MEGVEGRGGGEEGVEERWEEERWKGEVREAEGRGAPESLLISSSSRKLITRQGVNQRYHSHLLHSDGC